MDVIENETPNAGLSNLQRGRMVFHSFICIGLGLVGGLAWVISLAGYLELWPIPPINLDLPETKELWRNAHIGPIVNGIFVMAIAGISPLIKISAKTSKILYYTSLAMVWLNTIGYQTSPFTTNRGLAPRENLLNVFCYTSFYIAALCAFVVVGIGIYGSYNSISLGKKGSKI